VEEFEGGTVGASVMKASLSQSILFLIYVGHYTGNENGKEAEIFMSVSHNDMLRLSSNEIQYFYFILFYLRNSLVIFILVLYVYITYIFIEYTVMQQHHQ